MEFSQPHTPNLERLDFCPEGMATNCAMRDLLPGETWSAQIFLGAPFKPFNAGKSRLFDACDYLDITNTGSCEVPSITVR
jgi:hypothetical protein